MENKEQQDKIEELEGALADFKETIMVIIESYEILAGHEDILNELQELLDMYED